MLLAAEPEVPVRPIDISSSDNEHSNDLAYNPLQLADNARSSGEGPPNLLHSDSLVEVPALARLESVIVYFVPLHELIVII